MAISVRGVVTVLLPGTGSDDDYLTRALAGPLEQAGAVVVSVAPEPRRLVNGYWEALDRALNETRERSGDSGRIAVGGISLGAALAARWASAHPLHTAAVLAVLPPWTGAPDGAPAAESARHTAATLRRDGLDATTAAMRSSSPQWLADELARSWRRQWPALPDAMEEAAAYVAPEAEDLRRLNVPLAVVAASDDAIHPAKVAADWVSWAPRAAMRTVRLEEFGPNPPLLGQACVDALQAID
ncbi:MAG: alpha/beta fold hydrolase [Mycobacteriaceae bacterium]